MASPPKNISFYKGETWVIFAQLNDANGNPLNMTSGLAEFRISPATSNVPVLTLSTNSYGIGWANDQTGNCKVTVLPSYQTNLVANTYRYEVRSTTLDGTVGVQCVGNVVVKMSLFS